MSNVIKHRLQKGQEEKVILSTKPIRQADNGTLHTEFQDALSESIEDSITELEQRKNQLILEVEALQQSLIDYRYQIEEEKRLAQEEINQWWMDRRQAAEAEAEQLAAEAQQKGFEEGYEYGFRQVQAEFEHQKQEIQKTITEAYEERNRLIREAEPFLLDLSTKVAEKIICEELSQHPDKILAMIKSGLQQVLDRGEITLYVSPADYALVLPHIQELEQLVAPGSELKVIPDYSYQGMGCMIHTPNGSYDVTLDSQLEEIKKQLLLFYEESAI